QGTPHELQRLASDGLLFERMRRRAASAKHQAAATAISRQLQEHEAAVAAQLQDEEHRRRAAASQEVERQRALAAAEAARRDQLLRDALASEQAQAIRRYVARAAAAGAEINCNAHPVLCHMHRPDLGPDKQPLPFEQQDKRTIVTLERDQLEQWLHGTPTE